MSGDIRLSIVVPCFNEEDNVPGIVRRFGEVVARPDVEVIFVDNGSTDGTRGALRGETRGRGFARVLEFDDNRGYGGGIVAGLREARGEYIGWTHGDLQTDAGDTLRALEEIEARGGGEGIYAKGRRTGRRAADAFFTFGMGAFETMYLGASLWDVNAQPNVFHRSFFESWKSPPSDFSLDLYALYTARVTGLEVVRFPVKFPPRLHGESKWNTGGLASRWKFISRTLDYSVKLKKELR